MANDTNYICTVSHTDKVKGKFMARTIYTRDQMPDEFGKHYFKKVPAVKPDQDEKPKGKGVKK